MTSPLFFRSMRNAGTYLVAAVFVACGVSDRKVNEGAGATASVAGSSGAAAANDPGGTGGGAMTDTAGAADEAGSAGSTGNPGCINDSLRCADNTTPSECVDGTWVDKDPCTASKPVCSNGACAAATVSGGIVSVSGGVLSTNTVRLVEHGFEYAQTVCGTVGTQKVCVTGGIRP